MLIKRKNVNYVSMDRTFCISAVCPLKSTCNRSYIKLVGDGIVFPRAISMADFYHANAKCEEYEEG